MGNVLERVRTLTERVDDILRFADLSTQRTVDGQIDRWFGIDRHTHAALLLPAFVAGLIVLGTPSASRVSYAAAVAVATYILLALQMKSTCQRRSPIKLDLLAQVALVLATAGAVWMVGGDEYVQQGVYRHAFVPIAAALSVSLVAAAWLADRMFGPLKIGSNYADGLTRTELFASRGSAPDVTWLSFVTAAVIAVFRAPLALLTLPAIAALLAFPLWVPAAAWTTLIVCFLALFIASLNERVGVMWTLIQAVFFKGGASLVSATIIILAALRLAGFSYVTTVFDNAAGWSIGAALFGAYVLSWWFDYWTHRLVSDELLSLLKHDASGHPAIAYPLDAERKATSVPTEGRVLQVHGASRLLALNERTTPVSFQAHEAATVVEMIALCGHPGGKAIPPALRIRGRIFNFHGLVTLLLAAMIGAGTWIIDSGAARAQVTLEPTASPALSIGSLMARTTTDDRPLILLAASGGGTRAALYTASLLEGITRRGSGADVVLASGVSGGGAALAYYAGHRPRLAGGDQAAWDRYFEAMQAPYIQDVLDRALEWRIATAGRLGMLLGESFERRWALPQDRTRLEDINDIGLIFNTALAGHLEKPAQDSRPLGEFERRHPEQTKSTLAGGRLLLTNLDLPPAIALKPLEPGATQELPVIIRNAGLSLHHAASLNANFPPVFPNAAIDYGGRHRYWVTDGGAVDNRGLEMLLYAVRGALDTWASATLPRLHVVVADASAFSDEYTQDRGVGSLTGAGSRYASHLNAELVDTIARRYAAQPDRFKLSYVMMPSGLRHARAFGTHWMLQPKISVRSSDRSTVTVAGVEMVRIIRALHSPGFERGLTPGGCTVLAAAASDTAHADGWKHLTVAIGGASPPARC